MNLLPNFGVDFWKHLYDNPDLFAVFIAMIALFVTAVNVILVFIDWQSRFGKKLYCNILGQTKRENDLIKHLFYVFVVNYKASNICIVEISYVLLDDKQIPSKKVLFPSATEINPWLLNGYQAAFLPANFYEANEVFQQEEKSYYIRIKTSKGIYIIDRLKFPFYKKLWWMKSSVFSLEKIIAQQEKNIIKTSKNQACNL